MMSDKCFTAFAIVSLFGISPAPRILRMRFWISSTGSSKIGGSELIHIDDIKGSTRVELRSPDALSNPYLAYALLIHAGLYGIKNELTLPEEVIGESVLLPKSRKEAKKMAEDSEFIRDFLPKAIIDKYIS